MNLRKLTLDQVKKIYEEYLVMDFPKSEVKPLSHIIKMWGEGVYIAYGLYEKDELRGYAFFVTPSYGNFVLLDYFAIGKELRGGGYGSKFLDRLKEVMGNYGGMVLEVENPDFAKNKEDHQIMTRRIAFYEKNGIKMTEVTSRLFEVEYRIMIRYFGIDRSANISEELKGIYRTLLTKDSYTKNAVVR